MMIINSIADLRLNVSGTTNIGCKVLGYHVVGDGGGGDFYWDALSTDNDNDGTIFEVTGVAMGRWLRLYSGSINAKWFGAYGDGIHNDYSAVDAAQKIGNVFLPQGDYLIKSSIILKATIYGEGINLSKLIFSGLSSSEPAIFTSNLEYMRLSLENMTVMAKSWDSIDGALGYGIEAIRTINLNKVCIYGFKKSNIFFHQDATSYGPYYSSIENCYSEMSGEHGICVGTGANSIQIINCICRWNGTQAFEVPPSTIGSFDGLFISMYGEGNPSGIYPQHTPEGLRIIGGDYSYNSRYGVNLDLLMNSNIGTDYSEGNLNANQIRIGEGTRTSLINFAMGNSSDFLVDDVQSTVNPNQVNIGGVSFGTGNKDVNGIFLF